MANIRAKRKKITGNEFEKELKEALTSFDPPLLWLSESDRPLEVVRLAWWTGTVWPAQLRGSGHHKTIYERPLDALHNYYKQAEGDDGLQQQLSVLKDLFSLEDRDQRVFKRPTQEPAVFDFYLLANFGPCWVGLKTQIVET